MKARKVRNHSYNVVASKTSFGELQYSQLNNSKAWISLLSIGYLVREKNNKKWLNFLKIFYYIVENHILLKIIKTLEAAATEKCSKEQINLKNLFYMLYI